jgi:CCR4-Not complex component, Not1
MSVSRQLLRPKRRAVLPSSTPLILVWWLCDIWQRTWTLKVRRVLWHGVLSDNLLGQYLLLNSMVLHLRYPNAHTHWFSSLFLYLYLDASDDSLREIITRVLIERFVVHRPHPWGALVTFIELLRNPKYDFWSKGFVRAAPEVGLLLDGVSISYCRRGTLIYILIPGR